jgi:putative nucleotidyltransferase with HDIG domain
MSAAVKLTQEQLVEKLDQLPTLPAIIYELSQLINDPMSSTAEVEKLMSNDQSLTTKVLKLANSAYYAIPGGVSSLSRAIGYLGFDTVNQLVLSASIIQALEVKGPTKFDMNEFWKHCLGVAFAAETIAKDINYPITADMFTAGLVHDMGKIALYTVDQEGFLATTQCAMEKNMNSIDAELELGTFKHTDVGHLLSLKWKLPTKMQAVIKNHHKTNPAQRGGLSADLNQAVDIVLLANILIHALKFGHSGHSKVPGAPKDVMERLTIDPKEGFKRIVVATKKSLDGAEEFLRVIGN